MAIAVVPPAPQGAPVNPLAQIGSQIGGFLWGSDGQMLTPAQIAAQRTVAQAMMANAPAPRTLGEGLSAIGKALIAKTMMDQANTSQTQGLQTANDAMTAATAPDADPSALISAVENQYLTPGQQSVASAMLTQRMQLTNPDEIAQRAYVAAETAKDQAQANEMTTGGPNIGTPVQAADGSYYMAPTYGSQMRQLGTPGAPAPSLAAPPLPMAAAASQPSPASVAVMDMGTGTAPAAPVQLAPLPAAPAAIGGPFLTQAQQKQSDAAATAAGTGLGGLPVQVNDALASSRAVNPLYSGAINNVNRAINAVNADKGAIDFTTGLGGIVGARIPGGPGYDLAQALTSLSGLSALSTMASEKGEGASSPIQIRNQREFQAVAAAAGSLDQFQSKGQLLNSLKGLKAQLNAGMNNRAQDIGDLRTMGQMPGGLPASTLADPYAGPGAFGLINAAPDNQPVVTTPQEAAAFPVGTVVIMPGGNPGTVTPQMKAAYGGGN